MRTEPGMCTPEEAIAAVRACAFIPEDDPDDDPGWAARELERYPGGIVHCRLGGMGADWSADAAVELIKSAEACGWDRALFADHLCLIVVTDDGDRLRNYVFDTVKPPPPPHPGYDPMSREEKRRLIRVHLDLQAAVHVGNPVPIVEAMCRRMKDPQPGDWIVEMTTMSRLLHHDPHLQDDRWDGQVTRYLRSEMRTTVTGDEPDSYDFTEEVHVCENPDGTEFVWENATLYVIPIYDSLRPA